MGKNDVQKLFGTSVRAWRSRLGFSQEELAERAGLHRTYVCDIERGARNVSLKSIEKLARALNVRSSMLFDYDQIVICGPTFPHEVVGFSGGNKYFFPGVSGAEVINFSHWLGAVITSYEVIGTRYTPVRRVIDRAASFIQLPKLCFSMVVKGEEMVGLYIGSPEEAYEEAAGLSSQVHIKWVDRPFKRVL